MNKKMPSHAIDNSAFDNSTLCLWRLDPSESFSDWTIEVTRLDDTGNFPSRVETYHVHKNFLGCGPRKSSYFQGIFRSSMKEARENTTLLHLENSIASAFPAFLDFIYSSDMRISIQKVVGYRHLSDYFGVDHLKALALDILNHEEWQIEDLIKCFEEALKFIDEEVLALCVNRIAGKDSNALLSFMLLEDKSNLENPVHKMMSTLNDAQLKTLYFQAFKIYANLYETTESERVDVEEENCRLNEEMRRYRRHIQPYINPSLIQPVSPASPPLLLEPSIGAANFSPPRFSSFRDATPSRIRVGPPLDPLLPPPPPAPRMAANFNWEEQDSDLEEPPS